MNSIADYYDQQCRQLKKETEELIRAHDYNHLKRIAGDRNYTISYTANLKVSCVGCNIFTLGIPCVNGDTGKKDGFFDLALYTAAMFMFGTDFDSPANRGMTEKKITVISSFVNEKPVFFVAQNDCHFVTRAIECGQRCVDGDSTASSDYAKACAHIYKERNYAFDTGGKLFLNACLEHSDSIIIVDSINDVLSQFKAQDKQFIENGNRKKVNLRKKIIADFEKHEFLRQNSMTNADKFSEYSRLREFCLTHLPELNDREFEIDSLYEDHPDFITKEACELFKENWIRINRRLTILRRGISGEKKVSEVLELFNDRILVLENYTWNNEHDFIVITPYGISTIEVKNLHGKFILTETGILKCISSKKMATIDVAFQSKKHVERLRRNLEGCAAFSSNVPLQEIICSAEPNYTIEDRYHFIPVCYYNTIDKFLLPKDGEVVLNKQQMDEIYQYLIENKKSPYVFDVFLPRGEIDSRSAFIESFAEIVAGLRCAQ